MKLFDKALLNTDIKYEFNYFFHNLLNVWRLGGLLLALFIANALTPNIPLLVDNPTLNGILFYAIGTSVSSLLFYREINYYGLVSSFILTLFDFARLFILGFIALSVFGKEFDVVTFTPWIFYSAGIFAIIYYFIRRKM